jgi:hypothetical protein
MIIRLSGADADKLTAAREDLGALTRGWGHDLTTSTPEAPTTPPGGGKVVDPVSLAALILSIPSAALAVADLADRIHKRRRAKELLDHAQQLSNQNITIQILTRNQPTDLRTLNPDQLLDLLALDDTPPPD